MYKINESRNFTHSEKVISTLILNDIFISIFDLVLILI